MMNTRLTYKRPTALICLINAFLIVYVIYALFIIPRSLKRSRKDFVDTKSIPAGNVTLIQVKYTREQMERITSAEAARKALDAVDLMRRVEELRTESRDGDSGNAKDTAEMAEAVTERLENGAAKELEFLARSGGRSKEWDGADTDALEVTLARNSTGKKVEKGKLELHGPEIEDGIIPGKPLPPECNGEPHTDYAGFAVTWGLTHPQQSAADCCLACLAQARKAKKGEKKCNIWVYCPAEEGCYSPDIYVHKEFECWLKQDDEPRLNFKGKYDAEYRREHPNCPLVVPWASGVIG